MLKARVLQRRPRHRLTSCGNSVVVKMQTYRQLLANIRVNSFFDLELEQSTAPEDALCKGEIRDNKSENIRVWRW